MQPASRNTAPGTDEERGDAAAQDATRTLVLALRGQLGAGGVEVDVIETHISWVLLAGDRAVKIKKPVRLGSDVERKRLFGLDALEASAARVPGGVYGAEATLRTHTHLLEQARTLLG